MLKLKKMDYILQLAILLCSIASAILMFYDVDIIGSNDPFSCYYLVGSAQMLSAFFWLIIDGKNISRLRKIYFIIVIPYIIFSFLIVDLNFADIEVGILALFITPFFAIFYCIICYFDLKKLQIIKNKNNDLTN